MAFNIFGPTYTLLSNVLTMRSKRHTAISSNIANADTPGYRAVRVSFEDELQKHIPKDNKIPLKTTHENHMPQRPDYGSVTPTITYDTTAERPDGNTVDEDKEIVAMSKNQLMYNASSNILGRKLRGLLNAIREAK